MHPATKFAITLAFGALSLTYAVTAGAQAAKKDGPVGSRVDATGKAQAAGDRRAVKRLPSRLETRIDNRIGGSGKRKPSDATAAPK